MGPYQRTPKQVARTIRYSGLGVRSVGPVGDFLDSYKWGENTPIGWNSPDIFLKQSADKKLLQELFTHFFGGVFLGWFGYIPSSAIYSGQNSISNW